MGSLYLKKFAKLNANKNRAHWTAVTTHRAPHKPLLLLAVIDLFEQGVYQSNFIELNTDLIELFGIYWQVVNPPSKRGDISMPFFHLQSEGFWHLLPAPGAEERLTYLRKTPGLKQLQELTLGAKLDEDLFALWQTVDGRSQSRDLLIHTYFDQPTQKRLLQQTAVNVQAYQYSLHLLDNKQPPALQEEKPEYKPVRDQGFRRAVTTAYDHRCAFCGVRILTADGHTAIEAAHIIPWSESYDDTIQNGLALCRLCHWGFDEGLLSVGGRLTVLTSSQLHTVGNLPGHLSTLKDRPLFPPRDGRFSPAPHNLAWHRARIYRR